MDKPRQVSDEVVIHAIRAELWIGSQPIAMTQPQHTFGLPPRTVKEYARQLLDALYQRYGNGRRNCNTLNRCGSAISVLFEMN